MHSFYKSYIRAFDKYADAALESKQLLTITQFALMINLKANQLLQRATLNELVELPLLQKALFEGGRDYIHKFLKRLKMEKSNFSKEY